MSFEDLLLGGVIGYAIGAEGNEKTANMDSYAPILLKISDEKIINFRDVKSIELQESWGGEYYWKFLTFGGDGRENHEGWHFKTKKKAEEWMEKLFKSVNGKRK